MVSPGATPPSDATVYVPFIMSKNEQNHDYGKNKHNSGNALVSSQLPEIAERSKTIFRDLHPLSKV